jgi:hypothetical protein
MTTVCRQFVDVMTREDTFAEDRFSPVIVCRSCLFTVTDPEQRMTVEGEFLHAFANPHGHVFEIGCFSRAPGCVKGSEPSMEFTWFAGYAWQVGICGNCAAHLGWIFSGESHQFYGLILEKLLFP